MNLLVFSLLSIYKNKFALTGAAGAAATDVMYWQHFQNTVHTLLHSGVCVERVFLFCPSTTGPPTTSNHLSIQHTIAAAPIPILFPTPLIFFH